MEQLSLPFTDPIPGYRFIVFLNSIIMGFQKVSGISREVETETYHEGGLNTSVHIFPKYCSGERILRMEKGVCRGGGASLLSHRLKAGRTVKPHCYG